MSLSQGPNSEFGILSWCSCHLLHFRPPVFVLGLEMEKHWELEITQKPRVKTRVTSVPRYQFKSHCGPIQRKRWKLQKEVLVWHLQQMPVVLSPLLSHSTLWKILWLSGLQTDSQLLHPHGLPPQGSDTQMLAFSASSVDKGDCATWSVPALAKSTRALPEKLLFS